jgi:hypothetical protein
MMRYFAVYWYSYCFLHMPFANHIGSSIFRLYLNRTSNIMYIHVLLASHLTT